MGFRKTIQTLLGLPVPKDPIEPAPPPPRCRRRSIHGVGDGGGLRIIAGEVPVARNVVASSAVGSAARTPSTDRIDPGARGLHEPGGGADEVDHLGMCTESLGFESFDGISGEDLEASPAVNRRGGGGSDGGGGDARIRQARSRPREFPPPLSSLLDGRRTSFMRATRRDGRILIAEVTIDRPEVLRASRRDGRLLLELVRRVEDRRRQSDDPDPDLAAVEEGAGISAADPDPIAGAAAEEDREGDEEVRRPWSWERIQPASLRCQEAIEATAAAEQFWGRRSSFVTPA